MKNTTTEQKSLKNITTIDNITIIGKTAIKKITAKITTTALLFFLALFTLTTCLIAQESAQERKTGWFVGVSPYFLGAEIKTTTENTTLTERYTTGTRTLDATDVTFTASHVNRAEGVSSDGSWVIRHVVKVNKAKKNSKAVVVIFAVIFFMAVFPMIVILSMVVMFFRDFCSVVVFFIIVIFSMIGFFKGFLKLKQAYRLVFANYRQNKRQSQAYFCKIYKKKEKISKNWVFYH